MITRRGFLGAGVAAMALGGARRSLGGAWLVPPGGPGLPLGGTDPIRPITLALRPTVIDGVPFAPQWFGDTFPRNHLPFHQCESCGDTAAIDEHADVVVIGGGLSGLATAYHLRDRKPIVFELRPTFGGNAMGESWNGLPYSLGSAYFIAPDRGSSLESLYRDLGLLAEARVDSGPFTFEWHSGVSQDPCLAGCDPSQAAAVAAYQGLVQHYANVAYPEIPLPARGDEWIRALDRISLRDHLSGKLGGPPETTLPPAYAAAIQAYCYSSLGIGWDELSAAAAWNFIAAEEYGRVVLPGGNATLARRLWERLRALDPGADSDGGALLRAGCLVESVELVSGAKCLVRWRDPLGRPRATLAKHVVLANNKQIARRMIPQLELRDAPKAAAIEGMGTVAYLVANVLLRRPVDPGTYDLFLLRDSRFPMTALECERTRPIVDLVDGSFTRSEPGRGAAVDALTLYWPLPWHTARFTIVGEADWLAYAERGAAQVKRALAVLGIAPTEIAEVRLTRWGHAMPFAKPGQIADGVAEAVRRPIEERIWFVNQDNWLLPAVETCLLEAEHFAAQIDSRLGRR